MTVYTFRISSKKYTLEIDDGTRRQDRPCKPKNPSQRQDRPEVETVQQHSLELCITVLESAWQIDTMPDIRQRNGGPSEQQAP
jgi:hypothetical protein